MIDLHCHVLPGIDDGPQTIEESLAMVQVAVRSGIRTLVATPHVNRRYANRASTILPLVEDLNRGSGIRASSWRCGTERRSRCWGAAQLGAEELSRLRLGGGPWLLVEPPTAPVEDDVEELVMALVGQGHRVLLAHPERCPAFREDPGVLASLVGEGVLGSVTAASLRGHFGEDVARFALELLRSELIHNVASDAHHHEARPPTLLGELERAGLGPLAEWFTARVPAAILDGSEIPQRPLLKASAARPARRGSDASPPAGNAPSAAPRHLLQRLPAEHRAGLVGDDVAAGLGVLVAALHQQPLRAFGAARALQREPARSFSPWSTNTAWPRSSASGHATRPPCS